MLDQNMTDTLPIVAKLNQWAIETGEDDFGEDAVTIMALLEALESICEQERALVMWANGIGHAFPASFSLKCEKARAAIARVRGQS
jgi:hypothetical protein